MKKILLLIIICSLVLMACQQTVKTEVSEGGQKVTVEAEGQQQVVQVEGKNTDEWCATGTTWSSESAEAVAEMVIQGIETSGKYRGYCHVKYDVEHAGGQANVDFYFDEEGSGYQVVEANGQRFESEWTK